MHRGVGATAKTHMTSPASARHGNVLESSREVPSTRADRSDRAGPARQSFTPQLDAVPEEPAREAEALRREGLSSTADAPATDAERSTTQTVSRMPMNPGLANLHVYVEQPSGEIELGAMDRATTDDPPNSAEESDDLQNFRTRDRSFLQEHTALTPRQIDKTFEGIGPDLHSSIKALEDKYGKDNIPPELLREIMDLVKDYIKNLEEIAKGFSDLLKASAAR